MGKITTINKVLSGRWNAIDTIVCLVVSALYLILAKVCLVLGAIGGTASPFWLPSGLVFGATLLFGYRALLGIVIGQLLTGWVFEGAVWWMPIGDAVGNALEGGVFRLMTLRFCAQQDYFATPRAFASMFPGLFVGSGINAGIGAGLLILAGILPPSAFFTTCLVWAVGDLGGGLLILPVMIAWLPPNRIASFGPRFGEFCLLSILTLALSWIVFFDVVELPVYSMSFALLPILLIGAFRLNACGATVLNVMMIGIAVMGTAWGLGPFKSSQPVVSVALLQAFTLVLITTALFVMVINRQRQEMIAELRSNASSLEAVVASRTLELHQLATHLQHSLAQTSESEERFRMLSAAAFEGIAFTRSGIFVDANDQFMAMMGYDRQELIGMKVLDLVPEPHIGPIMERLRHGLDSHVEHTMIRKDGSLIYVESHGRTLHHEGDSAPLRITVVHDITARKQTEAQLRESEERFRSLVERTTDWVWETDDSHCFSWFSSSFDQVVGRPISSMIGKRRWDVASADQEIDASLWTAHIDDLTNHRTFRDFRYWISRDADQPKWISISGTPRFADDGTFLGYRGSGTDMTTEATTSMRLKMLSTVVEQSPVAVVVTDPRGTILFVNAHYTVDTGYSPEEAIGKTPRLHSSGLTPPETHQNMWETIRSGQRWTGEVRNRRKNGDLRWVALIISPVLDDVGHVTHFVAIMDDITQRRELQDKLYQTNADLEQFAYVASHDLRQPLRMVSSYLGLIEKQLGPDQNEQLKSYFKFAVDGAKRMDRLIVDLLEYSRTGRTSEAVPVDLNRAVKDAILNLSIAVKNSQAEITVADNLPMVDGNPIELVRLFQNLIGNAVKYCAEDRGIKVEIGWNTRWHHQVIWVKDNGIGIAPQDRDRAFMIFQRLVAKDAYEGTGIGLAVCKKIVEHHGGSIWIESELGQGSTFFMTFPRRGESQMPTMQEET